MRAFRRIQIALFVLSVNLVGSAAPLVEIDEPMDAPPWTLAQRALLDANAEAAFVAADKYNKYMDERPGCVFNRAERLDWVRSVINRPASIFW